MRKIKYAFETIYELWFRARSVSSYVVRVGYPQKSPPLVYSKRESVNFSVQLAINEAEVAVTVTDMWQTATSLTTGSF